jgi:cytochrome c
MRLTLTTLAFAALSAPAFAQGDAAAGEAVFKQCQTCHAVVNEAGEVLAGKNAKTGPNLYQIVGRIAGSEAEFGKKYGDSLVALGASGYAWTEEDLAIYVQDPVAFLKDRLGDSKAKSKMSFKLKKPEDAANVTAYLASLAPAAAAEEAPAEGEEAPAEGAASGG